ncbi:condensation domain-containing protein [Streptomyces lydicus]|uniref:condensation domain-containing protein n=1 Tax=Streptomyces lydicus TaxID=47763 RepID=UPI0036E73269
MSATEIIAELRALGVELWVEDGQIRFRAPQDLLTEERRAALKAHKADIIQLLNSRREADQVIPDFEARGEPIPLTQPRAALLLGRHESFEYGGDSCNGYMELIYPSLSPKRLADAWNLLVERHAMLRAVIAQDGSQHVPPGVDRLHITITDLRATSSEETEKALLTTRDALGNRLYDTRSRPLFEVRLTRTVQGDVLHISWDSMIADCGSAGLLLEELDQILADRADALPPLERTFRDCRPSEQRLRQTDRCQRDHAFWQARLHNLPETAEVPTASVDVAGNALARFRHHHFRMPAGQFERLRERTAHHGLTAFDVVLTAYAAVLDRRSRQARFTLRFRHRPLHRQDYGPVDGCAPLSLLVIDHSVPASFVDRARAIALQVRHDLEHPPHSGAEVLWDVTRFRSKEVALVPAVFTSALETGPGYRGDTAGCVGQCTAQTPQVSLDCRANDVAGELHVDWKVRQGSFPDGLIEDMFSALGSLLTRLADDASVWERQQPVALPKWQTTERATHPYDGQPFCRIGDLDGRPGVSGREDTQVKLQGHRIELVEIEAELLSHPAIAGAAAVISETKETGQSLLGFVEAARRPEDCPADSWEPQRLTRADADVRRLAEQTEGVPGRRAEHVGALHKAAWSSMLWVLSERGLFGGPEDAHSAEAVLDAAGVHERHHWLVRRWLASLTEAGFLVHDRANNCFTATTFLTRAQVRDAWARVEEGVAEGLCTAEFVRYHLAHVQRLSALLANQQNPFELLFPQGRTDVAQAVFRDGAIAGYLNQVAAGLVHRIAAAHDESRPLRVLELGVGTGVTMSEIVPLLDGLHVDYLRTDVSAFFLAAAEEEYAGLPAVRFGLFDPDGDVRTQGLAPNSADVVLCAGMLTRSKGIEAALCRAVELLAPGGWLIVTQPTEEHPQILLTQGFMMEPEGGDHEYGRSPLLSPRRRRELLDAWQAEEAVCLPDDGHPLAVHGMHLFAARVKSSLQPVTEGELTSYLAERLPAHMVPEHLQIVDALPLTSNGNVDRTVLAGWRPAELAGGSGGPDVQSTDSLEDRLAALWANSLRISRMGQDESFYERGADSLTLARVAGRLREEVPEAVEFPYSRLRWQMLNEPTTAALAQALRSGPAAQAPRKVRTVRNALLTQFGGGGDGPARILFHAALGTMDYLQDLGCALAAQNQGPVIGVAVADADAYCTIEPKRLLSRLADDYTQCLVDEGYTRFQLIGHCLGGLLAVEVARRMLERGLVVSDLTLVDSIPMFMETNEDLVFESIFVSNLGLEPVATMFGEGVQAADLHRAVDVLMTEYLGKVPAGALGALGGDPGLDAVAAAARGRAKLTQKYRLTEYARAASGGGLPVSPELLPALFRICRHSLMAARFDPEPYVGDMTFLRAAETQSFGLAAGVSHLAEPFWERICLGRFTAIELPGNHFSVISAPHLHAVVEHLAAPLLRAHDDVPGGRT